MHARKIALHKYSIIAIVLTLLVLGSALAVAGNSLAITPQSGTVSYKAFYLSGSNKLPATAVTVTVSTLSGAQVGNVLTGALNTTSPLPYGSYLFTVSSFEALTGLGMLVVNGTNKVVNVSSPTQPTLYLNLTTYTTHSVNVTVNGISSGTSATVSFSTLAGFKFETNMTSGAFSAILPTGNFFATVSYGGQSNSSFLTSVGNKLTLNVTGSQIFAGLVEDQQGKAVQHFNVVGIDNSSKKYTVMPFSAGAFQFVGDSGYKYYLVGNGYGPLSVSQSQYSYTMYSSGSNVTYNYSLDNNPGYLNLTVTYNIGNSTALPFMGNSSIGSFYYQYYFDNFASSTQLIGAYLKNLNGRYTDYSILVNGYNYNQTGYGTVKSASLTQHGLNYNITYSFKNLNVTEASLSNGFSVNLYASGTQYTYGSLFYNYIFAYNVPGLSLASPVTAADTFISPVKLLPQANSGWLKLTFSKANAPVVIASEMNLYWNNTTPSNYLVTSNSTSAVFVAPQSSQVAFNLSRAYASTTDYTKALNYTWILNGNVLSNDYNLPNATMTFTGFNNTVTVKFISASNVSNQTTFTVYAFNGIPTASLNVTSEGKTLFGTQTVSNTASLEVPQSKLVQFSAYYSSLAIPNTPYKVPLMFSWQFPGFTNTAVNVSQTFSTPWISSKSFVTGYLNVSTAVGAVSSVVISINVTDTTPPSPQMTLYNSTQAAISQPIAGQLTIFSANKTTDKYYPASDLKYSWKIVYANGTQVPAGSSTYEQVGNNTNLSYFKVNFNTLNSLIVSLKVTNPSNVSAYSNFTTSIVVNSPRLIVQSVYFPTTPAQGSKTLVYVNVSNNGTVNANSFAIVVLVNGKNVSYQTYGALPVGATKQFEFNLTSPSSGNVQFVFEAVNNSQPSFFATAGSLSVTHSVNPPAYQTPLIIGIVIAVIVLIGVAYYRLSARGPSKPRESKLAPKKPEEKKK